MLHQNTLISLQTASNFPTSGAVSIFQVVAFRFVHARNHRNVSPAKVERLSGWLHMLDESQEVCDPHRQRHRHMQCSITGLLRFMVLFQRLKLKQIFCFYERKKFRFYLQVVIIRDIYSIETFFTRTLRQLSVLYETNALRIDKTCSACSTAGCTN